MGNWSFPGVKRPERGVDYPPSSSAEVNKRVKLYIYSTLGPSWSALGWPLPLPVPLPLTTLSINWQLRFPAIWYRVKIRDRIHLKQQCGSLCCKPISILEGFQVDFGKREEEKCLKVKGESIWHRMHYEKHVFVAEVSPTFPEFWLVVYNQPKDCHFARLVIPNALQLTLKLFSCTFICHISIALTFTKRLNYTALE